MTCIDLYKNINVVSQENKLTVGPCCIAPSVATDLVDFHNNPYLVSLRQEAEKTLPTACAACSQAELNGMRSRRQGSNEWYQQHDLFNTKVELVRMDYWTGDLCNLACVICGPQNSSLWKQELQIPKAMAKSSVNKFWQTMDTSNVRFIHFNGGEPLLSKEHVVFLHSISHKNRVHLNYNTNATIRASAELLDLWQQFRLVQVDFSIDDIGQQFEYQRWPAKWSEVQENLQWYLDHAPHNCMFATNTSVGILNVDNIPRLNQWLKLNFCTSRFTDTIEHRQQTTMGMFAVKDAQRRKLQIIAALDKIDQRRGTDWKTTFPDMFKIR